MSTTLNYTSDTGFTEMAQPSTNGNVSVINKDTYFVGPLAKDLSSTFTSNIDTPTSTQAATKFTRPKIYPARVSKIEQFRKIRKYDGVILERKENSFWARLREHPNQYPTVDVEFELIQLPESDWELAVEGTPVVWTLGFGKVRGTVRRESILYIRRLLPLTEEELKLSRTEVKELMNGIQWE